MTPMETLFETLIKDAPEDAKESFPAQLHFRDGRFVAGQVSRAKIKGAPIDGLYQLTTVATTKANGQADAIMIGMFFESDAVLHLDLPIETSPIEKPQSGGLWMPGRG